ncbi:hypothetical protein D3C72_1757700 [compost metagenome]
MFLTMVADLNVIAPLHQRDQTGVRIFGDGFLLFSNDVTIYVAHFRSPEIWVMWLFLREGLFRTPLRDSAFFGFPLGTAFHIQLVLVNRDVSASQDTD